MISKIDSSQKEAFKANGFLCIEDLIPMELVCKIRDKFDSFFAGKFETGVYPDEWYWREGMSLPDVTRHMSNLWKSDLTIASVALSAVIGEISAELAGWDGARIGQDTLWMKPPGTKAVALHQDSSFSSSLNPSESITCWVALDDTEADAGTLEYVKGSHTWDLVEIPGDFHAPNRDYRAEMRETAIANNINPDDLEIKKMVVKAGTCLFHHGKIWHGSGPNENATRIRRSIGIHTHNASTKFTDRKAYIYGRYKKVDSYDMDESFFPILWRKDGYRTPFLKDYCSDALAPDHK